VKFDLFVLEEVFVFTVLMSGITGMGLSFS